MDRPLLGPVTVVAKDVAVALDGIVWVVAGDVMYRERRVLLTPDEADNLAHSLHLAAGVARRVGR